jgi:hypothetical protein
MAWSTRENARAYKKLLLSDKRYEVQPEILEVAFDEDGYQTEERKIS